MFRSTREGSADDCLLCCGRPAKLSLSRRVGDGRQTNLPLANLGPKSKASLQEPVYKDRKRNRNKQARYHDLGQAEWGQPFCPCGNDEGCHEGVQKIERI